MSKEWRVEVLRLATGERQKVLTPVSFNFEEQLNEVGSGSVTLAVRDIRLEDVWPHRTSIAFLRTQGPGASPVTPVCEFIGMVEGAQASSGGTVQLGLKSIEQYLFYRMINADLFFTATNQNEIGAALVDAAAAEGIPLVGAGDDSAITRDRTYVATERKRILEAVQQLTEVIGGPDYVLEHQQKEDGAWCTTVRFVDRAGSTITLPLDSRRGLTAYDIEVAAEDHVNRVVGQGEEGTSTYDAQDALTLPVGYPRFERSESYSDVTRATTVQEHAEGSLAQNREPTTTPSITLAGLEHIARVGLGDTLQLSMDHGAVQYDGAARVVGIGWAYTADSPTTATVTLVPGGAVT